MPLLYYKTMEMKSVGKQVIEDTTYGMYVWQTPDGEILGDDEGNIMNIFCTKGDRAAIKAITEAAAYYGFPEGKPVWWSGHRPITDEEYENQLARAEAGLTPDPLDIGAIRDEVKARGLNL